MCDIVPFTPSEMEIFDIVARVDPSHIPFLICEWQPGMPGYGILLVDSEGQVRLRVSGAEEVLLKNNPAWSLEVSDGKVWFVRALEDPTRRSPVLLSEEDEARLMNTTRYATRFLNDESQACAIELIENANKDRGA